jgi:hypothetical protein
MRNVDVPQILLSTFRQRREIATVVPKRRLQGCGAVRPGFVCGIHVAVGTYKQNRFGLAANFKLLCGVPGSYLSQEGRVAEDRRSRNRHQRDLPCGCVCQGPPGIVPR